MFHRRLYDEYRIEGPVVEWKGRQLVRASIQGYSIPDDVNALLAAVEALDAAQ